MANVADKSMATQTVRSGGFLWLNPIAISVVNCSRAEVVECSGLKPCWSGAGMRYLLMVGRIRASMTRDWTEKRDVPIWGSLEENVEFGWAKCITISIVLISMSAVNVYAISIGFLLVSLVTNRILLEEMCLSSFEVLNSWLNLVDSCLDDENEVPLKAPNDTAYKRWCCHTLLCKLCRNLPPPAMGVRFTFLGKVGHADPLDGWRCS